MHLRLLSLGPIISVIAMLNICGGPRLMLQSVAWAGMLIKYSQQTSLAEAVAETFDGDHPCNLCKGIQQDGETDQDQNVPVEKKWDLKVVASTRPRTIYLTVTFALQPVVSQQAFAWAEAPPVPPPRNTVS